MIPKMYILVRSEGGLIQEAEGYVNAESAEEDAKKFWGEADPETDDLRIFEYHSGSISTYLTSGELKEDYPQKIEALRKAYNQKILAYCRGLRRSCQQAGYKTLGKVWTHSDDEYRWCFLLEVEKEGAKIRVDVSVTLAESLERDGTDEGVSFLFDIVCEDGRILASFAPWNYTCKCWVPLEDKEAIEERWLQLTDRVTSQELLGVLQEFIGKETSYLG